MSPHAIPAWIVHVRTQAKNSHLKAYLVRAENPRDALRMVQGRCKLTSVDGIEVEVAGMLENEALLGSSDIHGLETGGIIRWNGPAEELTSAAPPAGTRRSPQAPEARKSPRHLI